MAHFKRGRTFGFAMLTRDSLHPKMPLSGIFYVILLVNKKDYTKNSRQYCPAAAS
jgi:hypothetical protein